MQKKILSLAVSILMVFTSISPGAGTVMAQDDFPVDQIREDEEKTITGMETAEETASVLPAAAGTEVQGEIVNGNTHTMTTGTYVVNENVTISPQNGGYNGIQVRAEKSA
jgi:hypothetical protein